MFAEMHVYKIVCSSLRQRSHVMNSEVECWSGLSMNSCFGEAAKKSSFLGSLKYFVDTRFSP